MFLKNISLLFIFSCYFKWFLINFWGLNFFVNLVSFPSFFFSIFVVSLVFGVFKIFIFCFFLVIFENLIYLFLLLVFLLFYCFWFVQYCFWVCNFNYSFCFHFPCVWEKVNPSFVCWAVVWTKTHAKCEWDHLWNERLQIKPTLMPTLVRIVSSKLFILLNIPT